MKNKNKKIAFELILLNLFLVTGVEAQQTNINRINLMPDFPSPYLMRDWEDVTMGYDSLVFNVDSSGEYLPLIFFRNNTVNYPSDISFGLHTVVGTTSPSSGEAINVIPAVVGASLVGIDKRNQNGNDWVKMCREYFNKRPEENVYLNHPSAASGDDWWYATMPNVFFYQLYDLYPETSDFNYQLRSVADQWLKATEVMGGSSTPWDVPNMNYRGWYLSTMTPNTTGVKEPESAGAIAWLLYNAYKETTEKKYRIGAEWAMEFLNNYSSNPSYELQLAYGAYIAAKMNAELGTEYDIPKLLNWCFDVGPLRSWGAIVGSWGGLDISGVIGEINGLNNYAFLMNTFEQAGALLPLLRYDDRFADALGKWMLNAANTSRLFYTNYLPDYKQDSEEWAHQYDSNSYIGHEAIRQSEYSASPYATGDAIDGNWGNTNLALYGSSHVGIFGSIIDTTNVPGILKLDLLKTDFFRDEAYPTYLIYNPYSIEKLVSFDIGYAGRDIYESTSNSFLMNNVSGTVQINIPSKKSYIIVITPTGGTVSYNTNKLLVDNVIVDYIYSNTITNYQPRIKSLSSERIEILKNDSTTIYCTAVDKDSDNLQYKWSSNKGTISGSGANIIWITHADTGKAIVNVEVEDGNGGSASEQIEIHVIEKFNSIPKINKIDANPRKIDLNKTSEIECHAVDDDGDPISYKWNSSFGNIEGNGSKIIWTAPEEEGNYFITCTVSDTVGASYNDSILVSVRDLSITQDGDLILFLPFNNNAIDESGNNNAVAVNGAVLSSDRFGEAQNSYRFNGTSNNIRVANSALLNFSNSITLNFWMYIDNLYDREQYLVSHGNWENRWKVSISNNKIRWTIKTDTGIVDIDSETIVEVGKWYNVTGLYSGVDLELYINGKLDAFKYWSGNIASSSYDLMLAQALPNNNQNNFSGKLDDLRLFNYALSLAEIQKLYDLETSMNDETESNIAISSNLFQNYPNPFNDQTIIKYQIGTLSRVTIEVYNILGQRVVSLLNEEKPPGEYSISWNGKNQRGLKVNSSVYLVRMKTGNNIYIKKLALLK